MKRSDDMRRATLLRTFGWPLLLGVLSGLGLVLALIGDGAWDAVSWLLLTSPVATIVWALARPMRG
jgi:hypothetical protein